WSDATVFLHLGLIPGRAIRIPDAAVARARIVAGRDAQAGIAVVVEPTAAAIVLAMVVTRFGAPMPRVAMNVVLLVTVALPATVMLVIAVGEARAGGAQGQTGEQREQFVPFHFKPSMSFGGSISARR